MPENFSSSAESNFMPEREPRRWYTFLWGSEDRFGLEHRLFNAISFITGVLWCAVGISNGIFNFGPQMMLVPLASMVFYILIYCIARFGKTYTPLVWPAALVLLVSIGYIWVIQGGSKGGTHIYFAIAPFIFLPFVRGVQRFALIFIFLGTTVGLLTLEYLRPGLIGGYHSEADRFGDLVSGIIGTQMGMAMAVILVLREFRRLVGRTDALRRKVEVRFTEVSDTIPAIICEVNRDLMVTYVNRMGGELTGYGQSDLAVGFHLSRVVHPDDWPIVTRDMAALLAGTALPLRECRIVTRDGTVKTLLSRSTARTTDGVIDGARLYLLDITEQKKLEEQYRQAQKMESVGLLAGGVAHDFNNILTAILGYARLIEIGNKGPDKKVLDATLESQIRPIISSSVRAADLIKKLLVFSRREKMLLATIDLNEVVNDVAVLLEHSLDKKVELIKQCAVNTLAIEGDRSLIQSAVLNLAVNARDAMPAGGRLLIGTGSALMTVQEIADRHLDAAPGMYAWVRVKDTGIGMDENVRAHLYEPFFTTKEQGKGTGLGLASVYGTVTGHRGFIEVTSAPGAGTTFTFSIPLATADIALGDSTRFKPSGVHTERIMVVEDEDIVRELAVQILRSDGYAVSAFGNAPDAVEYYRAHSGEIACVVLDMIMPLMNGRECYQALREINPAIKTILATGCAIDEETENLRRDGSFNIIQKPYDSVILLRAVAAAISPAR